MHGVAGFGDDLQACALVHQVPGPESRCQVRSMAPAKSLRMGDIVAAAGRRLMMLNLLHVVD
jgi:hypothetical protein